ncbi:uncharacterized protein N7498_000500 [Penicillium cinerascens]|uniref:Uncharacterized protein n=1 Tax=Penicillium cinerascens TaxID=70096 RepID=A0A9W9NEH5_9EURO|nr:uncharacterized protein N7498_000500 [Penicillium cinerascens]KAJ5218401.1 hypothetical protein N7498_000500 [Penicillium cinerascens]
MSETFEVQQERAAESSSAAAYAESSSAAIHSESSSAAIHSESSSAATPSESASSKVGASESSSAENPAAAITPGPSASLTTATKSSALIPTTASQSTPGTLSSAPSITNVASNNTLPSGSHKASYSGGTLAGAIVGSIAGTCLLALLAFLYLRRRRERNHSPEMTRTSFAVTSDTPKQSGQIHSHFLGHTVASTQENPSPPISPVIGSSFDLSSYIPAPADDNAVCTRIQTLFDQASLHIDNYYSYSNPSLRLTQDALACTIQYDSPFLPSLLATILSNPRAQRPALTHVLVRALLEATQPGSRGVSLLPSCYKLSPQQQETSTFDLDDHRTMFAWRMLTAHLYSRSHGIQGSTSMEIQRDAITALAKSFTTAFAPYSDPSFSEAHRLGHLTSVVRAAADLGAWLFSQPCFFEFRWTSVVTPLNQLIMFPAVVKVGNEQGRRISVPHTLVAETTARI